MGKRNSCNGLLPMFPYLSLILKIILRMVLYPEIISTFLFHISFVGCDHWNCRGEQIWPVCKILCWPLFTKNSSLRTFIGDVQVWQLPCIHVCKALSLSLCQHTSDRVIFGNSRSCLKFSYMFMGRIASSRVKRSINPRVTHCDTRGVFFGLVGCKMTMMAWWSSWPHCHDWIWVCRGGGKQGVFWDLKILEKQMASGLPTQRPLGSRSQGQERGRMISKCLCHPSGDLKSTLLILSWTRHHIMQYSKLHSVIHQNM